MGDIINKQKAEMKFNGQTTENITGAKREVKENKGRFDLIPPEFLWDLAKHYETGGKQKGDRNWEKGYTLHANVDSAFRHLIEIMMGDESEDHVSAIAWHVASIKHQVNGVRSGKLPKELWDLPAWQDKLKDS